MNDTNTKPIIDFQIRDRSFQKERLPLREADIRAVGRALLKITNQHRIDILKLLQSEPDGLCVTDIQIRLSAVNRRIKQPEVSQALSALRTTGLVKGQRDGKFVTYSVDADAMDRVQHLVAELKHQITI